MPDAARVSATKAVSFTITMLPPRKHRRPIVRRARSVVCDVTLYEQKACVCFGNGKGVVPPCG